LEKFESLKGLKSLIGLRFEEFLKEFFSIIMKLKQRIEPGSLVNPVYSLCFFSRVVLVEFFY